MLLCWLLIFLHVHVSALFLTFERLVEKVVNLHWRVRQVSYIWLKFIISVPLTLFFACGTLLWGDFWLRFYSPDISTLCLQQEHLPFQLPFISYLRLVSSLLLENFVRQVHIWTTLVTLCLFIYCIYKQTKIHARRWWL